MRFNFYGEAGRCVDALRIHDLRHFAASTLTGAGIEDNIIGLLTGHKSRGLRRYHTTGLEPATYDVTDLRSGLIKSWTYLCYQQLASAMVRHGMP